MPVIDQLQPVPAKVTDRAAKGNIMVVDDQPANLKLLEDMLTQQDYLVRSFPRGRLALAAAVEFPPDLILLDINMPEMNGFEVCERLKSSPKLSGIPVIFLSALSETEDKVQAFRSGGVDYVTKPFQVDEVQARVETQLKLYRLQRALEMHTEHLEELVGSRTRELAEAHARLKILDRSKSDFLQVISHELRTPLNGLLGAGELLLDELGSSPGDEELCEMFRLSRRRILTMLDDALTLTQIDVDANVFTEEPVSVSAILSMAIERAAEFAQSRNVRIKTGAVQGGVILGERDLFAKAFAALLETAVKFSHSGETVTVSSQAAPGGVHVAIESRGRTIPASAIPRFFEVFSIGEAITPGGDLGLGPPVAHRILALFGSSVSVENVESGIRITVSCGAGGQVKSF